MQIKIRRDVAEEIGEKHFTQFGINKDSWGWKKETFLNLADLTRDEIDTLRGIIAGYPDVRGTTTLLRDIDTWLNILHDKNEITSAKPRGPRQLEPLLVAAIGATPNKHIYKKLDAIDETYVCYYVEKVVYHPRYENQYRVIPEHTDIELWYEDFTQKKEQTITFWAEDCRGISVGEALARKSFVLETPALRKKYLSEIKRWRSLVSTVGKQCLAYGYATDDADGNPSNHSYYSRTEKYQMAKKDGPAKVLVDVFTEGEEEKHRDSHMDTYFWTIRANIKLVNAKSKDRDIGEEERLLEDLDVPNPEPEVPIHPYLCVYDLKRHLRLKIHVTFLADYRYDTSIIDKLILPKELKSLVSMLIGHEEAKFQDIVEGKSGGAVVLLCGPPGVGKTLTAEVYAEFEGRGLYSVQCSQLGVDPDNLEKELIKVFTRARRWGAVLLLDEADVYVRERGADLHQNAIVGVFLRVLEYQGNVLFLTTNRPDDVDDAIASRCIARLNYMPPTPEQQAEIWRVLSIASNIQMSDETIYEIVDSSPGITGRDVKNLLKLAHLVSLSKGGKIDLKAVDFAKQFKPTQGKTA